MIIFRRLDPYLLLPAIAISGVSLFLLVSTSPNLFLPQVIYTFIGILLYLLFTAFDFRLWPKYNKFFYILSLILLITVFFLPQIRAAHRWINLGVFVLQPSEILKPFVIVIFASLLGKSQEPELPSLFWHIIAFLPFLVLIFLQPDLGNAIIYFAFFIGLLIISNVKFSFLASGLLSFLILLPGIWFLLKDYQRLRISSFLNPHVDPTGAGYNTIQSVIAIGSGGLVGLGLGRGTQSRLLFLPEYQTDFIFASLIESLGLNGGFILMIFYTIILARIFIIALNCPNRFGRYLSIGIFCQIFIQIFINIGMNLGLLPITGITLPLLSSGGSSIVSTYISLGMVSNLAIVSTKKLLVIR